MDDLDALLARQLGLATRAQLRSVGVTPAALRWRLGRSWTAVLGQVVSTVVGPLTTQQRLVAACLEAGPRSVITADHACLQHGLRNAVGSRPVQVLVPVTNGAREVGFVQVRRTRRPVERPVGDDLVRLVPLARAVVDAARTATSEPVARALVLEAVQTGRATVEQLTHELESGPRRGSAPTRRALLDVRAGTWSVPEADLLRLCGRSRTLSHAWPNPRLDVRGTSLVSPDLWFDDVALAVMVHSRAHHQAGADWQRTVEQDGELTRHGVVVIAVTPRSIAVEPARVLALVEDAYRTAARRPRPVWLRMTPRGPGLA